MRIYRFSPLSNRRQLLAAVRYVVMQNTILCRKITGKSFSVSYVTIFSHFPSEYQKLKKICSKLGKIESENNGPKFILHKSLRVGMHTVTHLRIRQPDPYRMQVGCCDFDTDYNTAKTLSKKSENSRIIKRPDIEMIELFHPKFDVLSYVVKKSS